MNTTQETVTLLAFNWLGFKVLDLGFRVPHVFLVGPRQTFAASRLIMPLRPNRLSK